MAQTVGPSCVVIIIIIIMIIIIIIIIIIVIIRSRADSLRSPTGGGA